MKFNLELKLLSFELIDFFGLRFTSDSDCRSSFVEAVDSGIRLYKKIKRMCQLEFGRVISKIRWELTSLREVR